MTYCVELYTPLQSERGWALVDRRAVGTKRAADLCADALLRPHTRTETAYSARVTRGAFVQIETRDGRPVRGVDAPIHIVPSVGDLGVTP